MKNQESQKSQKSQENIINRLRKKIIASDKFSVDEELHFLALLEELEALINTLEKETPKKDMLTDGVKITTILENLSEFAKDLYEWFFK